MAEHDEGCPARLDGFRARCVCIDLRRAYDRGYRQGYLTGYNDHARAAQHWQDTHGVYRVIPEPPEPFAKPDKAPRPRLWPAKGEER